MLTRITALSKAQTATMAIAHRQSDGRLHRLANALSGRSAIYPVANTAMPFATDDW
jgi:hypothetical protein